MNPEYKQWLAGVKNRIRSAQIKTSLNVNTELIILYWELGQEINNKETDAQWGDKLIPQLSKDLLAAFPNMKGFSRSNLYYIKKWMIFYDKSPIVQQLVGQIQTSDNQERESKKETVGPTENFVQQLVGQIPQLRGSELPSIFTLIPWGHHLQIITKCKTVEEAMFYLNETVAYNWSRNILVHQIESGLINAKVELSQISIEVCLRRKVTWPVKCSRTPTTLIF